MIGLAGFATLVALFYTEENWRGKRAWERHRREWEARGEKFAMSSMAPLPVPDGQNFALTPLLKPPLEYSRVNGLIVWRDPNAWARLQAISANLSSRSSRDERLALGSLERGTLADLEGCRNFYRGNTNYPQTAMTGTAAEEIIVTVSVTHVDCTPRASSPRIAAI